MLLQLLGFAVALSMTATASAKAVSNDLPKGQACETSLRSEPKRAYYEQEKNYGTSALSYYNYTGETMAIAPNQGTLDNNEKGTLTISTGSNYAVYHIAQYAGSRLNIGDNTKNYDLYLNGELVTTLSPTSGAYGSVNYYEYNLEINSSSYVWFIEEGKQLQTQYGTAYNTIYNYSSATIGVNMVGGSSHTATIAPNNSDTYNGYAYATSIPLNSDRPIKVDIYRNKVYLATYDLTTSYQSLTFQSSGNYPIWVFDHTQTEDEKVEAEIGGIFTEVGNVVTGMADTLTKPWDGIINIFYDTTAEEVTPLGMVSLITLGTSVVIMLFAILIRLFRQRG